MSLTAAEFFAGMGLVREGLEPDFDVVFANDIDPVKCSLYKARFGSDDLVCGDIKAVRAESVPTVDLFTASFPCTDLSLAGNRAGLSGNQSSVFWAFTNLVERMGSKRPRAILIENVSGLGSSAQGQDLASVVKVLNDLGYSCDLVVLDAKSFVPQSRQRLFIIGMLDRPMHANAWLSSSIRPQWILDFAKKHPHLELHALSLHPPKPKLTKLASVVEHMAPEDKRWWDEERSEKFLSQLSTGQMKRLELMKRVRSVGWATAFRRTRSGKTAWEIRADEISGCLRTTKGGSSKQALVEAGNGEARVRWMTPIEYAGLQGSSDFPLDAVSPNQAMSALGDAVCVPVIRFLSRNYLTPLLLGGSTVPLVKEDPQELSTDPYTAQRVLPLG